MINSKVRNWGLFIAILATSIALAGLNVSIYQFVVLYTAPATALLILGFSLFLTVTVVGAAASFLLFKLGFAYGREHALKNPPKPGDEVAPYETKLVGLTLVSHPAESFLFRATGEPMDEKNSGRKPFYDDETVRAKIHKWEQQKDTMPAKTLAKLLAQEITIRPDGSLHVPLETFYLWRKRNPKNSKN